MARTVQTIFEEFGRRLDVETDHDGMQTLVAVAPHLPADDPVRLPLSDDERRTLIHALGGTVRDA